MRNKLPYGAIRTIGALSIVGIAGLTAFTVNMAINDANDRANGAYIEALSNIHYPSEAEDLDLRFLEAEEPTDDELVTEPEDSAADDPVDESSSDEQVIDEEPTTEEEAEEPTVDNQQDNSVDETPEDLGYDLTHVSINDEGFVVYTVQPGDWLSHIGDRYGFTVPELAAANPYIKNVDLIYSGNPIVLPGDDTFVNYVAYYIKKPE